jgi:hypothetical protein
MWSRYVTEYYSAMKRKEILAHAATWRDTEDTVLSEMNRHKRTHTAGHHSQEAPRVITATEIGVGLQVQGLELVLKGTASVWGHGRFWRWTVGMAAQPCACSTPLSCALQRGAGCWGGKRVANTGQLVLDDENVLSFQRLALIN